MVELTGGEPVRGLSIEIEAPSLTDSGAGRVDETMVWFLLPSFSFLA
jgi:hypothetical protein